MGVGVLARDDLGGYDALLKECYPEEILRRGRKDHEEKKFNQRFYG